MKDIIWMASDVVIKPGCAEDTDGAFHYNLDVGFSEFMADCVIRKAPPLEVGISRRKVVEQNLDYRVCNSKWLPCLSIM